jgi:hypothetical protein
MLDMIGAIAGTAIYAVLVGVLVGPSRESVPTKLVACAAAAAWGVMIVAIAALGGFGPGAAGPVPAPLFPFAACLALLFGSWFFIPRFRDALRALPLSALVALNAGRVGGVLFLLLAAEGRLSAPFAPSAGGGDIITGLLAIPLAILAWRGADRLATPLALWNAFGILDLIVAISLGLLSAPGTPFRVFTAEPGTLAMTTLPWILVPSILVPIYLLVHLTIAMKLRASPRLSTAAAVAG